MLRSTPGDRPLLTDIARPSDGVGEHWWVLYTMFFGGAVIGGLMLALGFVAGFLLLLGAGVAVVPLVHAGRVRQRIVKRNAADPSAAIHQLIAARDRVPLHYLGPHAAGLLQHAGWVGHVVRIAPAEDLVEVEPIAAPFEPRPLNDSATTRDLAEPSKPARRWLRPPVVAIGIGIAVIGGAITRDPVVLLLMLLMIMGATPDLWLGLGPAKARHVLLIPGGLVIRRGSWLRTRARLTRFTPVETALVLECHHVGGRWGVFLVGRERVTEIHSLRAIECQVLLAAWRSPLPPPTEEQLAELAG